MRRLSSTLPRVLPMVAALGFMITTPALAQRTPAPTQPVSTPPGLTEPMLIPGAVTPVPAQQGRQTPQAGQGISTTPPASAPRPETPRAPFIGNSANAPMSPATNIRLDLTITDNFTGSPVKKSVTMLLLTGNNGMIRTSSVDGWAVLNVDAIAAAFTGGLVSVRMTFEYTPALTKPITNIENTGGGRPPRLNESITVVLQDGKPLMVSQSADPATDRKVTAELTATILK
jgi:hypothetical protein